MTPVSLTMVRGTARTWYRCARWGNSVASTASPVMKVLSRANWWTSRTAAGQWGQVGVVNTWRWTGSLISPSAARVSGRRSVLSRETSLMASRNGTNSYPSGIP